MKSEIALENLLLLSDELLRFQKTNKLMRAHILFAIVGRKTKIGDLIWKNVCRIEQTSTGVKHKTGAIKVMNHITLSSFFLLKSTKILDSF